MSTALIDAVASTLEAINDFPCAVCGSTGETLPCIQCDKLLCPEHSAGIAWCPEHNPSHNYNKSEVNN